MCTMVVFHYFFSFNLSCIHYFYAGCHVVRVLLILVVQPLLFHSVHYHQLAASLILFLLYAWYWQAVCCVYVYVCVTCFVVECRLLQRLACLYGISLCICRPTGLFGTKKYMYITLQPMNIFFVLFDYFSRELHCESKKVRRRFFVTTLSYQILTDLQNSFTVTLFKKFAVKWSSNIPPPLKRAATLPCKMLMSENWLK